MSDVVDQNGVPIPFGRERDPADQRNCWDKGRIRHLRISDLCSPDTAYAIRASTPAGAEEVLYTLVLHPRHADRAEELRRRAEPHVGGVFSPDADVSR